MESTRKHPYHGVLSIKKQSIGRVASLVLVALSIAPMAHADSPNGWRWYNEPKPIRIIIKPMPPPQTQQMQVTTTPAQQPKPRQRTMTATEQMKWFHSHMEEVQNSAVIDAKDVNKVMDFMKLSQFIEGKTTDFGMSWKKALLLDPSLDYRTKHPTESLARQSENSALRAKKIKSVSDLKAKGFGLFFVYKSDAPLDKVLAPSIQAFSEQYDIELLGISLDGEFINAIKTNRANNNKLQIEVSPALLLVNPETQEMRPLAYGFISQEELLSRFHNVATEYAPDF